jgi:hypothetical protein
MEEQPVSEHYDAKEGCYRFPMDEIDIEVNDDPNMDDIPKVDSAKVKEIMRDVLSASRKNREDSTKAIAGEIRELLGDFFPMGQYLIGEPVVEIISDGVYRAKVEYMLEGGGWLY